MAAPLHRDDSKPIEPSQTGHTAESGDDQHVCNVCDRVLFVRGYLHRVNQGELCAFELTLCMDSDEHFHYGRSCPLYLLQKSLVSEIFPHFQSLCDDPHPNVYFLLQLLRHFVLPPLASGAPFYPDIGVPAGGEIRAGR